MISLILTIAILGLIVWFITTHIPMPPIFKTVIYVIVAIFLILFLMRTFGVSDMAVPRLR